MKKDEPAPSGKKAGTENDFQTRQFVAKTKPVENVTREMHNAEWDRGDFVPMADDHTDQHVTLRMSAHVVGESLEEEQ